MSDDRTKPKPSDTRGGVIPPGLEPFLRKRERPKTQKLGEDPELDAAAAAFRALDQEPDDRDEPPVQDLSIGMGNTSTYVGPTEVKAAKAASAQREPADAGPAKIEIAMDDVPRALPEGSRTRETVETKVLRPRSGDEDDVTLPRAPEGKTIGGGTARLPVVKAASPWAKEPPAALVAPVELPSAHASSASREPASQPPAAGARGRGKGIVLAGALVGIAALIVLRVATTSPETPGDRTSSTAMPATASAPASVSAATALTSAAPPASIAPSVQPTASAAAPEPPEPSTSAPHSALHAPNGGRHLPGKPGPSDDPYDAAVAPNPVVTVAPTAPPAPPPAPPPQPSVAPKPTASAAPEGDELMHTRPHSRSP